MPPRRLPSGPLRAVKDSVARAVELLERLVAIPSVTGSEGTLMDFLEERFRSIGRTVESIEVSAGRRNLFVHAGATAFVFTTHADTVPPFSSPRRQGDVLFARGACDAKGSLAGQAIAFENLTREGAPVGLLVLVGEERGSDGALAANRAPRQARYLVGGEPTGNRFVAGVKGCLRIRAEARGVSGHSSQPEGGRSAVPPMLDFLSALRTLSPPSDPVFGETTMNIGVLEAGTAPNVIADTARAEVLFRTGEPVETLLSRIRPAAERRVRLEVPYRSDPVLFRVPRGLDPPAEIVSFACDLPLLSAWGEPILVGPGSILDAHSAEEKVELGEIERAVPLYEEVARGLLERGEDYLEPRQVVSQG
jgi:acetylornithine deacetylase/succinyl-diaminopimelate desuccinylase-like protein